MLGHTFINRYSVEKQLGKSPGRKTLLARDHQTQELVVIKLLTFGEDFEWQSLKLFEREAEVLKSLDHPAIPRYRDYFEVERGFALVQTYIDAKSLQEHIQSGRTFSETEVEQVAVRLVAILTYLHSRLPPIIHRDIKPSNVLLSEQTECSAGKVYLVDFGSVQTAVNVPQGTITIVGTYGYMPMEQFGSQTVPASDLYSLGATLIYLITGRHPTELPQDDGRIAFEQVINLSPALANWLRWMTQPSLKRRPNSATVALDGLSQLQLGVTSMFESGITDRAQEKSRLVGKWDNQGLRWFIQK
jgi:serine/threonine protein kinase